MSRTMMSLGEFRFALETAAYERLALSQSWRWPEQQRLGRDPALQFVGADAAEIELEGVIYPQFRGGLGQIEQLREVADQGKPLMLTDGIGRVWGKWVITKISDTRTVLADDGQPRKIEFRASLKAYGDDEKPARWMPLTAPVRQDEAATGRAEMPAPDNTLDVLAETIESWPGIDDNWPQDAIMAAGLQSASILDRLGQTMGTIVDAAIDALPGVLDGVRRAIDAIDALPVTIEMAQRELMRELSSFSPIEIASPSVASGWPDIIKDTSSRIAGHGLLIAQASDLLTTSIRAIETRVDPTQPLSALADQARRAASISLRIASKWG